MNNFTFGKEVSSYINNTTMYSKKPHTNKDDMTYIDYIGTAIIQKKNLNPLPILEMQKQIFSLRTYKIRLE
jgi:hypothetical protein